MYTIATPALLTIGASWFGEVITNVEDANTFGHYPGRVRISTSTRSFNVTYGARYTSAITAIV